MTRFLLSLSPCLRASSRCVRAMRPGKSLFAAVLLSLLTIASAAQSSDTDDNRLSNAVAALQAAAEAKTRLPDKEPPTPATDRSDAGPFLYRNSTMTALKKHLLPKEDGDVRLVGGQHRCEGNVEVVHRGKWGAVCDDEWDMSEGHVICRQLNCSKAVRVTEYSYFGRARKRFWLDNLYCQGDERNLSDCRHDGWGMHDCTTNEGAGVICEDPAAASEASLVKEDMPVHDAPAVKTSIRSAMTGPLQIRLVGGRVREEGRVEVRIGDGAWGVICGDGWGMLEAMTVCKMLGLGYAQAPVQTAFFGGEHQPVILSGVECSGREASLADCLHDQMGFAFCPGRPENIAGVICTEICPDLVLDYMEIQNSAYLECKEQFWLQCAKEENCLSRSAYRPNPNWHSDVRCLLRFTARSHNMGTADFRPLSPKHLWQWHLCHMHYHSMEVFARFDIVDTHGNKVAEGHKASFCLEDNFCLGTMQPKYQCANYGDQGISVGCTDTYLHNVDCQWIDITDVAPGYYYLKVSINPEFKVAEITYENNAAICNVYFNRMGVHVWNCTMTRP